MTSLSWITRCGDVVISADDDVVTALLYRPAQKNAIDTGLLEGLESAVELAEEQRARVLVFRGADGTFCSGADLRELAEMRADSLRVNAFMARLGAVFDRIEAAPFPVLAVVEGHAVAGGCELMLACDIVVAASDARIGDRHVEYGLIPAAGGSIRLTRRLPPAQANYLLLTGNLLTGDQAAAWGLASIAVPPSQVDTTAADITARLRGRSGPALAAIKHLTANATNYRAFQRERELFLDQLATPDAAEGLAAFHEHRVPAFGLAKGYESR